MVLDETWFDVECYVVGDSKCTPVEQKILFSDMIACLMQIWSQCCNDEFYQKVIDVDLPEGTECVELEDIADDINVITDITARSKDGKCILVCLNELCPSMEPAEPQFFEVKAGKLYFQAPLDCDYTFRICYQRNPVCVIREVNAEGIPEYQTPDVPPEMLSVLKDHVKGRWYAAQQDWANASAQLQLADRGFDNIKEALEKEHGSKDANFSYVVCIEKEEKCDPCDLDFKDREDIESIRPDCWPSETPAGVRRSHEYSVRKQSLV